MPTIQELLITNKRILDLIQLVANPWPPELDIEYRGNFMSFYSYFCYLFQEAFPSVDSDAFESFNAACRLFASSLIISDRLVDGQVHGRDAGVAALRVQAFQFEAQDKLRKLPQLTERFWETYRKCLIAIAESQLTELDFAEQKRDITELDRFEYEELCKSKNAMPRVAVLGLCDLADDHGREEQLLKLLDEFHLGFQTYDDCKDWRADFRARRPTLMIAEAVRSLGKPASACSPDEVAHEIYYNGHLQNALASSDRYLRSAITMADEMNLKGWSEVLHLMQGRVHDLQRDMSDLVASNYDRIQRRSSNHGASASIERSMAVSSFVDYLGSQRRTGFGEARQIDVLKASSGFHVSKEMRQDDALPRALALLSLTSPCLRGAFSGVTKDDARYIVSLAESDDGKYAGYRLFQGVSAAPIDVMLTSTIASTLFSAGFREHIPANVRETLRCAARSLQADDPNWDAVLSTEPETRKIQEQFVSAERKLESDPAPFAELGIALMSLDETAFDPIVASCRSRVAAMQADDGTWDSVRYPNPLVASLRCAALYSPDDLQGADALVSTLRILQRPDGGWAISEGYEPDLLSTAAALQLLSRLISPDDELVRRAMQWLSAYRIDESQLITPLFRRTYVSPSGKESNLIYGSHTTAAAMAILALGPLQDVVTSQ